MFEFDIDIYLNSALKELDDKLYDLKVEPFELNVIGGFALLLHKIRIYKDQQTDIDYIGSDMPKQVKNIIDEIGLKYHLGRNWINNDVMLCGIDLEDFEYATGKLHFEKAFELNVITINVLSKEDLIRMKVIAIDTSYMAWTMTGEFTRYRDFIDVKNLMESLNWTAKQLKEETCEFVLEDKIYSMIEFFINNSNQCNSFNEIVNMKLKTKN